MTTATAAKFHVHDFRLPIVQVQGNPFDVEVAADFRHAGGTAIANVPGFCDGDGQYVIRFSPTLEGAWEGSTRSAVPALGGLTLKLDCTPNANQAVNGRLRVDPEHTQRFVFEDGTPFVLLGYEFDWMFAYHQRLGQPMNQPVDREVDGFTPALDLIAASGFNYLITNVYAHEGPSDKTSPWVFTPPDLFPWEGTNEQPDHSRPNPAFFRDFDAMMSLLHQRGLMVHLMIQVQNKKVKWPKRRSIDDDRFWRYVVARYQAYCNIVWDVSKETFKIKRAVDDPFAYALERMDLIRRTDAYGHLVTAHDTELNSIGTMNEVDRASDFVTDQTHVGGWGHETNVVDIAWRYYREAARRFRRFDRPYLNAEYGYELGVDTIKTFADAQSVPPGPMLLWTYAILAGGGYPAYYYNNTAWDLVKFDPAPESWKRYLYLVDFVGRMDLAKMAPQAEYCERGMCLAEPGKQFYVLLPMGGDELLDLSAVDPNTDVQALWLDITTGLTVTRSIAERSFLTTLRNPLDNLRAPAAVYVRVSQPTA